MNAEEAVVAILEALDAAAVQYMIVGSLASNFHGIPRSTRDADVVVELGVSDLDRLAAALPSGLTLAGQGAFEAVTGTTRYVIHLADSPFICELFGLGDDSHDRARVRPRMRVDFFSRAAWVATAEDMVITKLRWAHDAGRTKDRDDVRNIIAVRSAELDWAYVENWATEHGTLNLLEEIRRSVPPL